MRMTAEYTNPQILPRGLTYLIYIAAHPSSIVCLWSGDMLWVIRNVLTMQQGS